MIRTLTLCLCLLAISSNGWSQNSLKAASIFGDNMVIQQGIKAPVWGNSQPLQDITVSLAGKVAKIKADNHGRWIAYLPVLKAGGPFKMMISSSKDSIIFKDVLIGEVWLASGQSNMQMTLAEVNDANKEISEAEYPKIRFFDVERNISNKPLDNVKGSWKVCNGPNARKFSAVAYFFARRLHNDKKVPVGVISASWGSTPAEAFVSGESLIKHPDFKDSVQRYKALQEDWETLYKNYLSNVAEAINSKKRPPIIKEKNYPTALYNAMIAPLIPYGIKGVIWYQGESNANSGRSIQYRSLFPLLINDWRDKWDKSTLPFLYVQLANFKARNTEPVFTDSWASLREAQLMALKLPNTGMAVAIDIGDAKNIHPKNKQDVGERLYLVANHVAYSESAVFSGPQYESMKIENNKAELTFKHIGKGLVAKGDRLTGFTVAGADKKFYWAEAEIIGDRVVVMSSQVSKPIAVRYAWSDNPECNLFNKEGLPASPFRTDDW